MPERRPTMSAVDAASRGTDERATVAILSLEADLERERRRSAESLSQIQRRLERAEARAAETATVTDTSEDAPERSITEPELRAEPSADFEVAPGAAEGSLSSELSRREQELTREREAVRHGADDAQVRFDEIAAQVAAASGEVARIREQADAATATAVERVQAETEARMRSEAEAHLESQATELKAEADERVRAAVESARAEAEQRLAAESEESVRKETEKLAGELEQASRALRATEVKLREAEDRAAAAVKPRRFSLRRSREKGPPRSERKGAEKAASEETPGSDTETRVLRLVNLNEATFEQLRAMDMSVTQATRVIAYRERQDGFDSVDDLGSVPGFPKPFLEELKQQLST